MAHVWHTGYAEMHTKSSFWHQNPDFTKKIRGGAGDFTAPLKTSVKSHTPQSLFLGETRYIIGKPFKRKLKVPVFLWF